MIAATAILAASLLPASVGVGIGGAPVCPAAAVQPGTSVSLGTIYVVNTGSGSEDITLRAAFPANGLPGRAFPASWLSFGYPKTLWIFGSSSVTVTPDGGPTASPQARPASPAPAVQYSPASSQGSAGPNRDAWTVLALVAVAGVALLATRRKS